MKKFKDLLIFAAMLFAFGKLLPLNTQGQSKKYRFESVANGKIGGYGYTEVFETDDRQIILEGTGLRKTKQQAKKNFISRLKMRKIL